MQSIAWQILQVFPVPVDGRRSLFVAQPQPHTIAIAGNDIGDHRPETAAAQYGDNMGIGHGVLLYLLCSGFQHRPV
jgi:hypothetical protein